MKNLIQLGKFASVGGVLAVVSIIIYYITLEVFKLPVYPVYITVYCIAVVVSYLLNSKFTFNQKSNYDAFIKYFLVYLIGLMLGLAILYLLKKHFPFSDFINTLLTIVPRTIFVYIISKYFIFRS